MNARDRDGQQASRRVYMGRKSEKIKKKSQNWKETSRESSLDGKKLHVE